MTRDQDESRHVVALGTYERVLYGLDVTVRAGGADAAAAFAVPAHTGYVSAVAASPDGALLATGSTDESIRLFDLRRRRDVGAATQHTGTVGALAFAGAGAGDGSKRAKTETTHLLSAGDDGRLALFRTADWECVHVLRHKAPVAGVAVHPSGRLALSLGRAGGLRVWSLVVGRQAAVRRGAVEAPALGVFFCANPSLFVAFGERTAAVYSTEKDAPLFSWRPPVRLAAAVPTDAPGALALAVGEGTRVHVLGADGTTAASMETGLAGPRIKGVAAFSSAAGRMLVVATSTGEVAGYALDAAAWTLSRLFLHECGLRVTCLAACPRI